MAQEDRKHPLREAFEKTEEAAKAGVHSDHMTAYIKSVQNFLRLLTDNVDPVPGETEQPTRRGKSLISEE